MSPSISVWSKSADRLEQNVSKDPNGFIEYSNTKDDVYENIDDYNPDRKRKVLIVFDDLIAEVMANKKFQALIKELFIRCRKVNTSLALITQYYFFLFQRMWD